jgi:hypothetical protein
MPAVTTCNTSVGITVSPLLTKTLDTLALGNVSAQSLAIADSLISGTGAGTCNQAYMAARSLAAGANETLDLYGSLTNGFADTISFKYIRLIVIRNNATPGSGKQNNLLVGGVANPVPFLNGATDSIMIPAGGCLVLYAGQTDPTNWTVTNGTGDKIKITSDVAGTGETGALNYDLVVVGEV